MSRLGRGVRHALAVLAISALGVPAAVEAAEDAIGGDMIITKGMQPWEGCGECHDLDGVAPNGHFPSLAGQKPAYFRKQMDDFRAGTRTNDHGQMGVSSRELVGDKLERVIGYFAALPAPPPQPLRDVPDSAAARAHRLVAEGSRVEHIPACARCHGAHPRHAYDAPCLEAQQAGYIVKQLQDFKAGRRDNDPKQAMRSVARLLSDQDIELLAAYLASRPRAASGPGAEACGASAP